MRLKIICTALTVFLCVSLTACTGFSSTDSLLVPPKPIGNMYPIQRALEKTVKGSIKLKYPTSGDYRSAIILEDLDGTGENYAVAFYATSTESTLIHINLLHKTGDQWDSLSDLTFNASSVDKVAFGDISRTGVKQIIVGFTIFSSVDKKVAVYSLTDSALVQRMEESYNEFLVTNLRDDRNELFVLNLVPENATAKIFTLENNVISEVSSCELDGTVTSYSSVNLSKMSNDQPAVFIDALKGKGMITEIVYAQDGHLINPFFNEKTKQNDVTYRDITTASFDIKSDGHISIPLVETMGKNENEVNMTRWVSFNGAELTTTLHTVMNYIDGYFLIVPTRWIGNTSVERQTETRTRIFSLIKDDKSFELMRVKVVPLTEFEADSLSYKNWQELARDSDFAYICQISDYTGAEAIISSELKSLFRFIS